MDGDSPGGGSTFYDIVDDNSIAVLINSGSQSFDSLSFTMPTDDYRSLDGSSRHLCKNGQYIVILCLVHTVPLKCNIALAHE